ncbi:9750_t:CDS:2, partial [Acaulospora colombiana]
YLPKIVPAASRPTPTRSAWLTATNHISSTGTLLTPLDNLTLDSGTSKLTIFIKCQDRLHIIQMLPNQICCETPRKQCIVDDEVVYIELDDLENLEYCSEYVRHIDGFLLVYSITDKHSLDSLAELLKEILRLKGAEYVPLAVVGNKCDAEYDRQTLRSGQSPQSMERIEALLSLFLKMDATLLSSGEAFTSKPQQSSQ